MIEYGFKKTRFDHHDIVVTAEKPTLTWRQWLWVQWEFTIKPILIMTGLILCLAIAFGGR